MNEIERVIEYWDAQPCNIHHSRSEFGTQQYFDEVEARKYFVEPHIKKFANFPQWWAKNVLEVGCGIGTDAINFARCGANYTGIDISTRSIEITKQRFDNERRFFNGFQWNIEEKYPGFSNMFDLVYSFGVLHHTPNPRHAIQNIRRVIKNDGELRIMLYATNSWKAIMIEAGLEQAEAQAGCPVVYTYDEDKIRLLLDGCFEIQSITQTHIFPYDVEKYKNYEYELQPYFKAMSREMFMALEERLGWHLLIVAKPE